MLFSSRLAKCPFRVNFLSSTATTAVVRYGPSSCNTLHCTMHQKSPVCMYA
jgi:hypothetical protein